MKKNFLLFSGIVAFLCCFSQPLYANNTVTLATLDWEPYIGEKLQDQGYVASLVREAYKATGYTVEISFMPWARVVALAKDGKYDGYLPEYYADSLKADFLISESFPGGPLGFFKRKSDTISFTNLSDLKAYKIGVVRDYVNTAEFDKADFLQKDAANNDITNLRKLIGNRLDLVVADKFVGSYLLQQDMPDKAAEIEFMTPVLEEKSLYLCISKKVPDAEGKIKAFNDGLKTIKDNGVLAKIMKAHGF